VLVVESKFTLVPTLAVGSLPLAATLKKDINKQIKSDKMETFDKKGLLVSGSSRFNETYQKQLYINSRKKMETNAIYLQKNKNEVAGCCSCI